MMMAQKNALEEYKHVHKNAEFRLIENFIDFELNDRDLMDFFEWRFNG
jgi:hypothetical protein